MTLRRVRYSIGTDGRVFTSGNEPLGGAVCSADTGLPASTWEKKINRRLELLFFDWTAHRQLGQIDVQFNLECVDARLSASRVFEASRARSSTLTKVYSRVCVC